MPKINQNELDEILKNLKEDYQYQEILDFFNKLLNTFSKTNKPKFIINEFIRELEKTKNLHPKKPRLIKLILDLEIKDLSIIEELYALFDYPFPYQEKVLSDLYDETLRLYIKEEVYQEPLEDTYLLAPVIGKEHQQTNQDKYKICLTYFIKSYIGHNLPLTRYEEVINQLFLEIYFSTKTEDNDANIFTNSSYYTELETLYSNYIDYQPNLKEKIEFDQFKYVILFGLLDMIVNPNNKTNTNFRKIITLIEHSYVMQLLTDTFNYDKYFSYNALQTIDQNFFNNEKTNSLFTNYFTDVLINLRKIIPNFKELNQLTKPSIQLIVLKFRKKNEF